MEHHTNSYSGGIFKRGVPLPFMFNPPFDKKTEMKIYNIKYNYGKY